MPKQGPVPWEAALPVPRGVGRETLGKRGTAHRCRSHLPRPLGHLWHCRALSFASLVLPGLVCLTMGLLLRFPGCSRHFLPLPTGPSATWSPVPKQFFVLEAGEEAAPRHHLLRPLPGRRFLKWSVRESWPGRLLLFEVPLPPQAGLHAFPGHSQISGLSQAREPDPLLRDRFTSAASKPGRFGVKPFLMESWLCSCRGRAGGRAGTEAPAERFLLAAKGCRKGLWTGEPQNVQRPGEAHAQCLLRQALWTRIRFSWAYREGTAASWSC